MRASLYFLLGLLVFSGLAADFQKAETFYALAEFCFYGVSCPVLFTNSYLTTTWTASSTGANKLTITPHNWGYIAVQTCTTISFNDYLNGVHINPIEVNQHLLPFLPDPTKDIMTMKCAVSGGEALFEYLLVLNGKSGVTFQGSNTDGVVVLNVNLIDGVLISAMGISGSVGMSTNGCKSTYEISGTLTMNDFRGFVGDEGLVTLTLSKLVYNGKTYSNLELECVFQWYGGAMNLGSCQGMNQSAEFPDAVFTFMSFDDNYVYLDAVFDAVSKPKVICTYLFANKSTAEDDGEDVLIPIKQ